MKIARPFLFALVVSGIVGSPHVVARGDEFFLEGGGHVTGELLNPNQVPRTDYVVRTAEDVIFKIDRTQVAKKALQRPEAVEYERIWPRFADTVEDQWKVAEWCREHTLADQRERHLKQILQLDPDHEETRRALGYVRRNGRWTTREEQFRDRGYVFYEGEWRTTQEIQLIEEDRRATEAETEWLRKLKTYRDQLASGNAAEGRRGIQQMRDPAAIAALSKALKDEENPNIRQLYLNALGNLETNQAAMVLAAAYMKEPVDDLRYTCLDHLKGNHNAVDFFVGQLQSSDNGAVNLAGFALGYLEDSSAIGPLIRSLVTFHKVRVKQGNSGQMSTGFSSNGGTAFSAGGSDVIVNQPARNRAVLDALTKLTGQRFGFDMDLWRKWHANQRRYEYVNARRD